ncbi:transporter substrate-binding domain-containing protein [Magnetovibrio sp. PR-2]|uniref:substrate-binding periplasmic protein n=1 Tax=Magnetovibrio sp. PR-2 TaxID=3120356 RepID=UPI002FCE32E2
MTAFVFLASPASAEPPQKTLNFAYGVVEGFIEEETSGVGYELMRAVLSRLQNQGHEISVTLVPFTRLLNGFQKKHYDLAFPIVKVSNFTLASYKKWGFDEIPLYSRPLYNGGEFVIYTPAKSARLSALRDLIGRDTVVIAGAYIPIDLVPPTSYSVEQVNSGHQAFKMVKFGRVDAFLVHEGWGKSVLTELDISDLHHGQPFGTIEGGFIAQNDEQGKSLIAAINQIISDIIDDGTYAKILKKFPDSTFVFRHE